MKVRCVLTMLLVCLMVGGCLGPFPQPDPTEIVATLLSEKGIIHRPKLSHGDDWYAIAYDRRTLLFETDQDTYGNPTGLSDDTIWSIQTVTIRCSEKADDDTIYNPGDPFHRKGFMAWGFENACVWYPLYTTDIDIYSGLPYAPFPLEGYPFDSCRPNESTHYPEQTATITARASRDRVLVRIVVPPRDGATYALDVPWGTPQDSNTFEVWLGVHGTYRVIVEVGGNVTAHEVLVPVDWFWISGQWTIPVGPTGVC